MSAATSPGTGLAYGLRRVCAAWGMARSSFYAMTSGQHAEQPPAKRRGPKPAISDQALLVAIEADLEASPWEGEGYRKVWARLRVCRDIRVARKRVLRLMRENNLLSPHRCRRRGGNPHDGEIITHAPNLMRAFGCSRWTTAGAGSSPPSSIGTPSVSAGMSARGDRFAALQPISMGLAGLYGSTEALEFTVADVVGGLARLERADTAFVEANRCHGISSCDPLQPGRKRGPIPRPPALTEGKKKLYISALAP